MGTNYYALTTIGECECCGRQGERYHIGKTSMGWVPGMQWMKPDPLWPEDPTPHLTSWREWKDFLRSDAVVKIENEYREVFTAEELIERFESTYERMRDTSPHDRYDFKIDKDGWRGSFNDFS